MKEEKRQPKSLFSVPLFPVSRLLEKFHLKRNKKSGQFSRKRPYQLRREG